MSSSAFSTSLAAILSLCSKNWGNGNDDGFWPGYRSFLFFVPSGKITRSAPPSPSVFGNIRSIVIGSRASDGGEPNWLIFSLPFVTRSPALVEGELAWTLLFLLICLSALPCHITVISCIDFFFSIAECCVSPLLHFLWERRVVLVEELGRVKSGVRSTKNWRTAEKFMVSARVAGLWILVFF